MQRTAQLRRSSESLMRPSLALRRFVQELQPIGSEVIAARRHIATIAARLEATFGLPSIKRIGSHTRGTAIATFSDVDVLAVLPRKEARWGSRLVSSDTYIRRVAADLQDRYTGTSVRRDGQAVVLNFKGGAHSVDVVPGFFRRFDRGRPVYLIPDSDGDWLETSPEQHNRFFQRADERSGGKLRRVSQLIKGWRFARVPPYALSSFYTDLLLATTDIASGAKTYSECLRDFFRELVRREVRGLQDPIGIARLVVASASEPALDRLYSAAVAARDRANEAVYAESRSDSTEARRLWGLIFRAAI